VGLLFNQPLTREDAVAAVVRLYNSEMLDYDPTMLQRIPTQEDETILAQAEAMKQAVLSNTDALPCEGTPYYISGSEPIQATV
jgi:hypothetical protein